MVKRERLDYYGFMIRFHRITLSLLIVLAFGTQQGLAQTGAAPAEAENNSLMSAELFYQLLLG